MAQSMICQIVAPDKMLYSGEAEFVAAPAADGEIGFLYLRSPFMSTLKRGLVRIKEPETSEARLFAINGGYLEADGHKIVVLASHAINVADIDVAVANERIAHNEQLLETFAEGDSRAVFTRQEIDWQRHLITLKK